MNIMQNQPALWQIIFKQWYEKFCEGRLLVYASNQQPNSALLATRAARRIGAGNSIIAAPREMREIFQSIEIGAWVEEYMDTAGFADLITDLSAVAVLIGPGSGINISVRQRIISARQAGVKIILDSNAITALSGSLDLLIKSQNLSENSLILVANQAELFSLFGKTTQITPEYLLNCAQEINGTIVFKCQLPLIACHDGRVCQNQPPYIYWDISGASDVLSGIVAGLIAQELPPFEASAIATYCHTKATNILGKGLICEDIASILPNILKGIYNE